MDSLALAGFGPVAFAGVFPIMWVVVHNVRPGPRRADGVAAPREGTLEGRENAMTPSIEPTGRVATGAEAMDPVFEAER